METFSALLAICAENSPVPGEFSTQRPVTRSFDVYFDLRPNKGLSKQLWGWWFETQACPLWRHRNGTHICGIGVGVGGGWNGVKLIEAERCIYASQNEAIIDSDNGLSPDRYQAIIWTNAGVLSIRSGDYA